jgi:hypothetical protein
MTSTKPISKYDKREILQMNMEFFYSNFKCGITRGSVVG